MYAITVEARFSALHRLRLKDGRLEPVHGHDWQVRARFARADLDRLEMVADFHDAKALLEEVVAPLDASDLNEHKTLGLTNPTAERVARYIFDELERRGMANVRRVDVVEAPGCTASYERDSSEAECSSRPRIDDERDAP